MNNSHTDELLARLIQRVEERYYGKYRGQVTDNSDPNNLGRIKAKVPGQSIQLTGVNLDFNYQDFGPQLPATGYERLLYDCMIDDTTLFHRWDDVEASWRIATPVLDLWATLPARDFPNYASGTWGPAAADELLRKDGRAWVNPP